MTAENQTPLAVEPTQRLKQERIDALAEFCGFPVNRCFQCTSERFADFVRAIESELRGLDAVDAKEAALKQARRVLEEVALDLVNTQLDQGKLTYSPCFRPHRLAAYEKEVADVKEAIAAIDAAMSKEAPQ